MKKTSKLTAILTTAVISVSMCSVEASADSINPDKIIFSETLYQEKSDYANKVQLWIDESYNYAICQISNDKYAAIKTSDSTDISDLGGKSVMKLSKVQLAQMKHIESNPVWGSFFRTDIEITDNVYLTSAFSESEDIDEYCRKLVEDGIADYARPIEFCDYGTAVPGPSSYVEKDMKEAGIDVTDFNGNKIVFKIIAQSNEAASGLKPEDIKGLKETISAWAVKDNVIYFQFKENAPGQDIVNTLKEIVNNKKIEFDVIAARLTTPDAPKMVIPEDYPLGDINRNKKTDLNDAVNIAKYLMKLRAFNDVDMVIADYDENGKVNMQDIIKIAKAMIPAKE